ncbi:hypothetical protein MBLNU13_g08973t1 [Cladosporium sp. NU13]
MAGRRTSRLIILSPSLSPFIANEGDTRSFHINAFITTLSLTKVVLTITKYIPQALSHTRSRSTLGFSITQVLLDTGGGVFSLAQLLLDSYGSGDGGGGWAGVATSLSDNPGKLGLAGVSLFFDAVFVVQHYVLYGPVNRSWRDGGGESNVEEEGEQRALLG